MQQGKLTKFDMPHGHKRQRHSHFLKLAGDMETPVKGPNGKSGHDIRGWGEMSEKVLETKYGGLGLCNQNDTL